MLVCLNGEFIPHEAASLPISDGAFLFGDSLFETLKARGQKILLQKEHLDRLELKVTTIHCKIRQAALTTHTDRYDPHILWFRQRQKPASCFGYLSGKVFGFLRHLITPRCGRERVTNVAGRDRLLRVKYRHAVIGDCSWTLPPPFAFPCRNS